MSTPSRFDSVAFAAPAQAALSVAQVEAAARAALRARRWWALALALLIAIAIPAAELYVEISAHAHSARIEAGHMADELSEYAVRDPAGWSHHVGRFALLHSRLLEHAPGAAMRITAEAEREAFRSGGWPLRWAFEAVEPVYDAGLEVGTVALQFPASGLTKRVALAVAVALLLALAAYVLVAFVAIGDVQRHIADLRALRDAAERAGLARQAFLASMSHEIRTPMNGVIGIVDLLRDTPLDEQQRHYLEVLRKSGQTLLRVINDTLDYSRLESGMVQLETAPFAPAALTQEVVELLLPLAQAKGLRLAAQVGPGVPPGALGDDTRVRQVLLNLVGNAVKFSHHGAIVVHVDAASAGRLRWSVADEGIGMTPEQQRDVFAPFAQADASIARRYGGTGLGLAIARRLVAAMGGEITLRSEAGAGSTFTFEINAPPAAAPGDPVSSEAPGLRPGGLRVLVAEDDEVNTLVALAMLGRIGVRADAVPSGLAAVEAVRARPYDLVLMDVSMPDIDGMEAARRIRAFGDTLVQPRIVALTAHVMDDMREQCAAAGMEGYLSKPLESDALARTVTQTTRL